VDFTAGANGNRGTAGIGIGPARHWRQSAGAGQSTSVDTVILLDNPRACFYTADGHSRIDLARQAIRQVIATLHTGDRAALIPLTGDNPTLARWQLQPVIFK